ncbi:MAG TPA: hypothetical protein PLR26_07165 [Bacilli bacterium]|nr:hypothetical protein [Bacilli bacterium]
MSLELKVTPILDSHTIEVSKFKNIPVYNGVIVNEIAKPDPQACFLGAWYRKVVSSKDYWVGIEGTIELGEFTPDKDRFNLDGRGRYADNPSVYMGGHATLESDAGLGMNMGYPDQDTSYELTQAYPKICWRPFWRYIYNYVTDDKGNVNRYSVNSWNVSDPRHFGYYYFPGDVIRMAVYSPIPDYMQLRIEVVKPTTIPKYVEQRKKYGLKDDLPHDFYSPIFHSKGHGGLNVAEFKRVNAIDQFGNEGYVVKHTKATVSKASWKEVYLYRYIDGTLMKVPFNQSRYASMICPNPTAFTIDTTNVDHTLGGENIEIHPGKVVW